AFQIERSTFWRNAVFFSEFAHPVDIFAALLHCHIEINSCQLFSESANVEIALNLANAGHLFFGPAGHQSSGRSHTFMNLRYGWTFGIQSSSSGCPKVAVAALASSISRSTP